MMVRMNVLADFAVFVWQIEDREPGRLMFSPALPPHLTRTCPTAAGSKLKCAGRACAPFCFLLEAFPHSTVIEYETAPRRLLRSGNTKAVVNDHCVSSGS
jgi:hypothetical protein